MGATDAHRDAAGLMPRTLHEYERRCLAVLRDGPLSAEEAAQQVGYSGPADGGWVVWAALTRNIKDLVGTFKSNRAYRYELTREGWLLVANDEASTSP